MPSINDRANLAADKNAPETALRALAGDRSPKVREAVAQNPAAPADILELLVEDKNWHVRFAVAENPSPDALHVALGASDADVRGRAAQREDLNAADVESVLADRAHTVRERLAETTTDADVAASLARDPHPAVRASILQNSALREDDVERLARDPIARVRGSAAATRRVRPATLTLLAGDRSAAVRWAVLVHNPERLDLARRIADDTDELNAGQAGSQLGDPRWFTEFLGNIELID